MSKLETACWRVERAGERVTQRLVEMPIDSLSVGQIRVAVHYSSLNFKDALAWTGHKGVARSLPITPGIDAVGEIVESASDTYPIGQRVIVGHADFGTNVDGGWSKLVTIPDSWVTPLPEGFGMLEQAVLGTAGFTAAGCVEELVTAGVILDGEQRDDEQRDGELADGELADGELADGKPGDGKGGDRQKNGNRGPALASPDRPVVVTGATGGVGSMAVALLAQLGVPVVASTGKPDQAEWLRRLGANSVIDRSELVDESNRPLLSARWAGAVDTVGGLTLASILRSCDIGGCVAACGVVAGADLPLTVYPFILRGVKLAGVDSANSSNSRRIHLWNRLSSEWRIQPVREALTNGRFAADVDPLFEVVDFADLPDAVEKILAGKIRGRVVVKVA